MDLNTITMDPAEAQKAFEEYRDAVRERHDEEDRQIMRAYKEAAKGAQLIRLSEVMAAGCWITKRFRGREEEVRLPKLAVARAHHRFAWTRGIRDNGSLRILGKQEIAHNNTFDVCAFGAGTFTTSEQDAPWAWGSPRYKAMAPNIPPPFRPKHSLKNYFLLWEAEWKQTPMPPGDPALLKRIGGDLYAVLAVWDLTEIERAVLAARRP